MAYSRKKHEKNFRIFLGLILGYELASAYFYRVSSIDVIDPSEAPLKMLGSTFSKELPEVTD
jgi:uncharacterized protein YpmB